MENHGLASEVRYLLKKGHSAEEVINLVNAPKRLIELEISNYLNDVRAQSAVESSRRAQASYAMKI